jgi:S-adenosylmethionine hydrolase
VRRTPPVVALLSDFGDQDIFVGVMKGVVLARCPQARLVDLTHAIEPGDVAAGALMLRAAVPYFPPRTVFLAVVDPGVGSARRPICIAAGQQLFVGPDNGLLWPAGTAVGEPQAFELAEPQFRLPAVSATFHGRDVFAPAAAALAAGTAASALGPPVPDPARLDLPAPRSTPEGVVGEILWVDRFGNLITDLTPAAVGPHQPGELTFSLRSHSLPGPAASYSDVESDQPCVVLSSFGTYEFAVRDGSAAELLHARRGDRVLVTRPRPWP